MVSKLAKLILIILIISIVCITNKVNAISTSEANDFINTERICSLELTYEIEKVACDGLEIEIYQIASVSKDFQYNLVKDFKNYPISLNGIEDQDEWNELCKTFEAYIVADKINPTQLNKTDKNGNVEFLDLPVGIYLVRWKGDSTKGDIQGFAPFLMALPSMNEKKDWIYNVKSFPKPGMLIDSSEEVTVTVIWKDARFKDKRPDKVSVDIYRDEEFFKTIELSEKKNWTFSWKNKGQHSWSVIEKDLPSEYKVTYNSEKNLIIITNTIDGEIGEQQNDNSNNPRTVDNMYMYLIFTAMSLFGITFTYCAIKKERKNKDE